MPQIRQQQGSSTTGLLTASAIFIALLVYANQYAFEDSTAQARGAVTQDAAVETSSSGKIGEQPVAVDKSQSGAGGTFPIPTAPTAVADHNAGGDVVANDAAQVEPFQTAAAAIAPVRYGNIPSSYPSTAYGYRGDRYQSDFNAANLQNLAAYQSLRNDLDARGRGRGRGAANGDGEFDFSMKFKSRARFDADTEMDGDWLGDGNGIYYGNYYQDAAYYPGYSYGYYRY